MVLGDHTDAFRDDAICHLESVLSSHHIEEKITAGDRSRFFLRVAEQEYVVQNPTDQPALFTIRVHVPENWSIDSDPQPTSLKDVHYIDSSGIGALVSVHMAAGKAQSVLELTNLQPRIRDLFELTRLTTVFENHGGYRGLSQD